LVVFFEVVFVVASALLPIVRSIEVSTAFDFSLEKSFDLVVVAVVVVVFEEGAASSRAFFLDDEDIEARKDVPPFFTFFFPR